jgi:hypothetical protein
LKGIPESIDRLIAVEMRPKGFLDGVIPPLYAAARARTDGPLVWEAARRLHDVARSGHTIFIATGHVHPEALPKGETDGPPGAASLARALVLGFGCPVVLLTEATVVGPLTVTCEAAGLRVQDSQPVWPRSVGIRAYPIDQVEAAGLAEQLATTAGAVVTIEKIGRNRAGVYHTGQGNDVSSSLGKVDLFTEAARRAGAVTIGIGDLGNEIGMGAIEQEVRRISPHGDRCQCACQAGMACKVATDHLIVAGVSNWGAYGLSAALAAIESRDDLLHTPELEREMIFACCRAGAVDGLSTGPTLEVDGIAWQIHAALVEVLHGIIRIGMTPRIPERHRFEVHEESVGR